MALPRFPCPRCQRPTAVTLQGRLYRHDPPVRDPELKSCPGSLKLIKPRELQAVLFAYEPPALEDAGGEDSEGAEPGLF